MAMFTNRWNFIYLLLVVALSSADEYTKEDKPSSHLGLYKRLFEVKRKEQIETAEQVWKVADYAHQYKTVKYVMEAIFPVLQESLQKLSIRNFSPNHPFPEEQEMQDLLGKVYENVIFLGDFVLRMPDITKQIFRKNINEWKPILVRAVEFCRESGHIIAGPHATQLHLMSQELGLIPEDPDYVNPFRAAHKTAEDFIDNDSLRNRASARDKKKQEKNRGPRLRGGRHPKTEL